MSFYERDGRDVAEGTAFSTQHSALSSQHSADLGWWRDLNTLW
jgi:hypothetical protein